MHRLFLILLLFALQNSNAQTYSSLISDKEIIDFINEDISKDSIKTRRPIRQNFWKPDKETFYYSDSADFARKNNSFPPLFIFKRQVHRGKVYTNGLDSIFSRADIDFFLNQIESFTSWNTWIRPFKNSSLIREADMADKNDYHKVKDGKVVFIYSLPLFSIDKRKAIIIKGFYCGFLCGGHGYYVYSLNEKNEWVMIKEFNVVGE